MKSMTDLPVNDIWPIIFSNLSINDLFNCRLVNKKFKYFSDHTNGLNSLIIGEPNLDFDDYYWYCNNKSIDDQDIISLKCFRSIKLLSIFNLDKYLKYLKIYDQQLKLNELSNLINLESLEFGRYYESKNQQIINLKNLKVIASNYQSIKLNAPKLEKIQFISINRFELDSNPESIKHLITYNYVDELKIFKNLEIMELRDINQSINENMLIIFKNLKQLKIDLDPSEFNYPEEKNSLIKILNDKMKLKKKVDIYLEGVKIENIDKLNELETNGYPYWNFRLDNYNLLDFNLSFINYLHYDDELERSVNNIKNDLPSTFFDKFQYITDVYVNDTNDVGGLNWLLKNLKCLKKLQIGSRIQLGQIFYDNLPNSITSLFLYNKEDINHDFILKFSKLVIFSVEIEDKNLSDLIIKLFSDLKYFREFKICGKISIEKKGKNLYYLNRKELNFNQIMETYKIFL